MKNEKFAPAGYLLPSPCARFFRSGGLLGNGRWQRRWYQPCTISSLERVFPVYKENRPDSSSAEYALQRRNPVVFGGKSGKVLSHGRGYPLFSIKKRREL
jgi:hypothetical protein